jgi:hypothetical protein
MTSSLLALHPDEVLDLIEGGHRDAREQVLPREKRAIQLAPAEDSSQAAGTSSRNWISSGSIASAGSNPKTWA